MNTESAVRRREIPLAITVFLLALGVGVYQELAARYGAQVVRGYRLPYLMIIFIVFAMIFAAATLAQVWFPQRWNLLIRLRQRLGRMRWPVVFGLAFLVSWFFVYSSYSLRFDGLYQRLVIYLAVTSLMAWLASDSTDIPFAWSAILAALVIMGCAFLITHASQNIVSYPFGRYWSEGNRYYDYSLLYGRRLYDYPANLPLLGYIDIGRQSLWGLPFLFGNISIWGMRLWNEVVFIVPYLLLGWVFLRQPRESGKAWFLFGLWVLLFLNMGPIYSPLVLTAILVAAARRKPLWLAAILVFLAGYYARLTRFTWLFAPAIWAALIAFLEEPAEGARSPAQRWKRAITLGIAGILGGYAIPELLLRLRVTQRLGISTPESVVNITSISQMVGRQPLIWDRLWPNETYAPGIVLGFVIVCSPLLVLLLIALCKRLWKLDFWQYTYLSGMFLAFLGVGLVVSLKIGGGSNLHNLDMLLIALVFCSGLALEAGAVQWLRQPDALPRWGQLLLLAAIIYPASQDMLKVKPLILPSQADVQQALEAVDLSTHSASQQGEILFIDHRQLLTFGYIKDIPLVPDYEKKFMIDLAMAGDQEYFEKFYQDLADHRFSLIISEPMHTEFQETAYNFGYENNAWVQWISIPLLCYYTQVATYPEVSLEILAPKTKSLPAEGATCPEY